MTVESAGPSPDVFGAVTERLALPADLREQKFWTALALAILSHSALLAYASHTMQRVVGEKSGVDNPLAVSILTEDEFLAATGQSKPSPPAPELKATLPPEQAPPQPQQPPQAETEFKTETVPEDQAKPAEKPASDSPQSITADNPDLFTIPEASLSKPQSKPKTAPANKQPANPSTKPQNQAKLDLGLPNPSSAPAAPSARSASFTRPAGITRSGENDAFGRGVLAAMQRAMPGGDGQRTAVILRTLLDPNGNVISIELLGGNPKASLTEQLIFAMRTATYPFPPRPSTVADRTFEVRYIWR